MLILWTNLKSNKLQRKMLAWTSVCFSYHPKSIMYDIISFICLLLESRMWCHCPQVCFGASQGMSLLSVLLGFRSSGWGLLHGLEYQTEHWKCWLINQMNVTAGEFNAVSPYKPWSFTFLMKTGYEDRIWSFTDLRTKKYFQENKEILFQMMLVQKL